MPVLYLTILSRIQEVPDSNSKTCCPDLEFL